MLGDEGWGRGTPILSLWVGVHRPGSSQWDTGRKQRHRLGGSPEEEGTWYLLL